MKHSKLKIHLIAQEFFQFSLMTYLILLLIETLQTGFVSYFFNLNILLGIVLISGILLVLTNDRKLEVPSKNKKITRFDIEYIIMLALGGGILVFYKTQDFGPIALILAGLTAVIILLLSLLLMTDK